MSMFSDAYEEYAPNLVAETPVLVQGNVLGGTDGVRINVRECYPLDRMVASARQKDHLVCCIPTIPNWPRSCARCAPRSTGTAATPVWEFGFVFPERIAPFAAAGAGFGWKLVPAHFQQLRAHPAVAGALVETKPLQLKETRRWGKR